MSARRRFLADAMVGGIWVSAALAVAMYLASGASAMSASPSGLVTGLGIVAGLIGTDLVLVMLVLAARIPLVDRTVGHDRAIALHRTLGKPALCLLLGHGVLLLVGYAIGSGVDPVAEAVQLWSVADMPLAFLGIGLLLIVVVTSLVAVRRRFSYELWHVIHLLSYAAVLVAVPHQLSVGGVFAANSAERAYWITLYGVAFGAIGIYRFIEPAVSSLRHSLRVESVDGIAPGVVSIHLHGHDLESLGAAGGQYFVWRFWTGATWWHSHPVSLSAAPTAVSARITVRDLGAGTSRLGTIAAGTRVSLEGPYGRFTEAARTAPSLAIVVAGIGITPARALVEQARLAPGEATIVLRGSQATDNYLWEELRVIAEAKGALVYSMVGTRATNGPAWMPQRDADRGVTLSSIFPRLGESDLYLCGPPAWLDAIEADARSTGMPAHRIHTERFDW